MKIYEEREQEEWCYVLQDFQQEEEGQYEIVEVRGSEHTGALRGTMV